MPAVASRPTVSGTPHAKTGAVVTAPSPQAVTTSSKPSVGAAAAVVAHRPFKNGVAVPCAHAAQWPRLAESALDGVGAAS